LEQLGIGYTFLTNNSSRSSRAYLERLRGMGIIVRPEQLYSSTQAAIEYLLQETSARRLFVLGTTSMREEMAGAGFTVASDTAEDEPDAVVVGFDTELTFAKLCRAAYWLKENKLYVATHPDRVCPTDQPTVLVDCGSVCAALQAATGRVPDVVLGKPHPCMVRGILQRHRLRPEELAIVGDRLYTDMEMARTAASAGVLVLTGETTAAQAAQCVPAPDLVVAGLAELGEWLQANRVQAKASGGWEMADGKS
jgi:NagD protein